MQCYSNYNLKVQYMVLTITTMLITYSAVLYKSLCTLGKKKQKPNTSFSGFKVSSNYLIQ